MKNWRATRLRKSNIKLVMRVLSHALNSHGKNITWVYVVNRSKPTTHGQIVMTFKYPIKPSKRKPK